jgi:hypothetical protein
MQTHESQVVGVSSKTFKFPSPEVINFRAAP